MGIQWVPQENLPPDEDYVSSMLLEAVVNEQQESARYMETLLFYLQGREDEVIESAPYDLDVLLSDLEETFGNLLFDHFDSILRLIYGTRKLGGNNLVRCSFMITTVIRGLLMSSHAHLCKRDPPPKSLH